MLGKSDRSRELSVRILHVELVVLVLLFATSCSESVPTGDIPTTLVSTPRSSSVLCLNTDFFTTTGSLDEQCSRLHRELVRQAILIAARDGLGLSTRDATLQEPFPNEVTEGGDVLRLKLTTDGLDALSLRLSTERDERSNPSRAWGHSLPLSTDCFSTYIELLGTLEPLSRHEFVEALRGLGFSGEARSPNKDNEPPEAVEKLLCQMNFVSQYAAVRAAHAAIKKDGESAAWLGVLARGYANLALMTHHHWWSDSDAFAARALLYAERMVQTTGEQKSIARAHRAYVRAMVGMHAAALEELKQIEILQSQQESPEKLPAWCALIDPYCKFKRQEWPAAVPDDGDLSQLKQRLTLEQYIVLCDERLLFEAARQALRVCPEAYEGYDALAVLVSPLAVKRIGANYGPAAMGSLLPDRVATLPELPKEVEKDIDPDQRPLLETQGDPNPNDPFSALPSVLARDLIAATARGDETGEPSWAVLGELIEEEEFVQAANYTRVLTDATESSLAKYVEAILPLIKGHRYSRYVESYSVNMYREPAKYEEIIGDMEFVEPNGYMAPMLARVWGANDEKGQPRRGERASWLAFFRHDFTLQGMLDPALRLDNWWSSIPVAGQEDIISDLKSISPHAPQVLRMTIHHVGRPTLEQIKSWQEQVADDPTVFERLGGLYHAQKQYDDAIRCYEKSIELSPGRESAYASLADSYRAAGEEEKWLPTLERFLKVESLGLEHAHIHEKIARDFISKNEWEEAEPHALEAANTWSGSGLALAAFVYEGLNRWDESEKWVREESTSYPTYSGDEWYFWCRRTGRGDTKSARKVAEEYFSADWFGKSVDGLLKLFTCQLLDDDSSKAIDDIRACISLATQQQAVAVDRVYYQLHLALLAKEQNQDDEVSRAVAEARRIAQQEVTPAESAFSGVILFVCDILDGKKPDTEERAEADQQLSQLKEDYSRTNYNYFIGRAYELQGEKELADGYLRNALRRNTFERYNATLAGYYLSKRHGTSTPDPPAE